ncbi:hypothetical protein [Streptomyces sp. MZ04]|uniref:MmyB family transcriptional regulator n=1 Tax=Streptomyces sp. MZ04 TaxID=2559236 RepID=UPI00107E9139|nr:hypothetical protein [Streptomyces sp. MZ04]TGB16077.1 hypothetical protein E2651_01170 [Streptomyces sp. MZ04]
MAEDELEQFRTLLQTFRERVGPTTLGLPPRDPSRRGPRMTGPTQDQVNYILGWGRGKYAGVEGGKLPGRGIQTEHLHEIASLFRLTEDEYRQLHLLALGVMPPGPLYPDAGVRIPSQGEWQRVVDGQREIAYVTNVQWGLVAWNAAFARLFRVSGFTGGRGVPENMMDWMLFSDLARHRLLLDWERSWAPSVLSQLHSVALQNPENDRLGQLMERVRADPVTRRIFNAGVDGYKYPDGDSRPLWHPDHGIGRAVMASAHPSSAPQARLIVVCFDPDAPSLDRDSEDTPTPREA